MSGVLIVERGLVELLGGHRPGLTVVPRARASWWRRRGGPWAPLAVDVVVDVLTRLPSRGIVLARPATADPGAACLAPLGRLLGHEVVVLPDGEEEAAWAAAIVGDVGTGHGESSGRVLQVLCCGPGTSASFPRQQWGRRGISVPALRPSTLARWASCAWTACRWCAGGGLPGTACRRCGTPIPRAAGRGDGR